MQFVYGEAIPIKNSKLVKMKKMKHIAEIVSVANMSNGFFQIQKLDKERYLIKETGEVKEYQLSEHRAENIAGLKDSFRKIRDLINNNFEGACNELHLTLTYADNMTDPKQLYADFQSFWERFKRKYKGNYEYMSVVEPQGRGAWHCHVLIKETNCKKLYIKNSELAEVWGKGFVKIKALAGIDNIGAYLSAYLSDVELTEENIEEIGWQHIAGNDIKEVEIEGKSKKFIKGARLHMYPSGMNLYRKSKGIIHPEIEQMTYIDAKKIVGSSTPNYSSTLTISDEDKTLNTVTYEHYNMKRKSDGSSKDIEHVRQPLLEHGGKGEA